MLQSIWVGGAQKKPLLQRCEQSWPQMYKEWNEGELYPLYAAVLKDAPYLHEAMAAKHWAAASDLLRLVVLWHFGGVYVDADVEVIDAAALRDQILRAHSEGRCIIGLEDSYNVCGAVMIAPPRHPFITRMLDVYAGLHFADTYEGSGGTVNSTTLFTREAHGRADVCLLDPSAFHPIHFSTIAGLSMDERLAVAREFKSITLHHFDHSWNPNTREK